MVIVRSLLCIESWRQLKAFLPPPPPPLPFFVVVLREGPKKYITVLVMSLTCVHIIWFHVSYLQGYAFLAHKYVLLNMSIITGYDTNIQYIVQ